LFGGAALLAWVIVQSTILFLQGHSFLTLNDAPPWVPSLALAGWMERHRQLLTWIARVLFFLFLLTAFPDEKPKAPPWNTRFWKDGFALTVRFWRDVWTTGAHRLLRYLVLASTLGVIAIYTWFIFPLLPQRYGFGRPTTVQLLVDSEMLPLLSADKQWDKVTIASPPRGSFEKNAYLSEAVELIFIADNKEYVLRCGDDKRIITIESTAVKGIVWRNDH